MSNPIQFVGVKVEINSAFGTAKAITGITKASEAVVSCVGHGLTAGELTVIDNVVGMSQINGRVVRVKAGATTDEFTCEGLDSTGFSTYVSGGTSVEQQSLIAFDTLANFDYPEPQPNVEDLTTIHALQKKEAFGLDSAPTINFESFAKPFDPAIVELRKASNAKTERVGRATFNDGTVMIFNATWAGGRGLSGAAGAFGKGTISVKLKAPEQYFAS